MIHLHHLKQSRSFRIIWLLEEMGIDYQLTTYERKNGLAPKRLKEIHPLGKAPILQDNLQDKPHDSLENQRHDSIAKGDKTLVESAVIIDYLIDHYDTTANPLNPELLASLTNGKQFRPDYGTPAYDSYRYWLHFAEGSLMPLLVMQILLDTMVKKSPLPIRPISKMLKKGIDTSYLSQSLQSELVWIDQHLAKHDWFAGEQFSGADIQMAFGLDGLNNQQPLDNNYPNIANWLKKCHIRPAYQKAMLVA